MVNQRSVSRSVQGPARARVAAVWLLALSAVASLATPAAAADAPLYTVVAATSVDAKGFDKSTLSRLFLGRTRSVSGARVALVVLPYKTPAVAAFLDEVVGMSVPRFESYWRKRLFSSRGTPPRIIATDREALALVVRAPGTIAVVPAQTVLPDGVHAVAFPAAPPPVVAPRVEAPPVAPPPVTPHPVPPSAPPRSVQTAPAIVPAPPAVPVTSAPASSGP